MSITDTINAQIKSVLDDIRALPTTVKGFDVAALQKKAESLAQTALGSVTSAYADLAKKSDDLVTLAKGLTVDDVRAAADDFASRAEAFVAELRGKVEDVKVDDLKDAVDDFREKADVLVDDLKDRADEIIDELTSKAEDLTGKAAEVVEDATGTAGAAAASLAGSARIRRATAPAKKSGSSTKKAPAAKSSSSKSTTSTSAVYGSTRSATWAD